MVSWTKIPTTLTKPGLIPSQLVIIGSHSCGRPKLVQPGGRPWVMVIQGIGAGGAAIPPYATREAAEAATNPRSMKGRSIQMEEFRL